MLRPLVLSILILSLLAAGLPVSDSLAARWSRRASMSWRAKKQLQRRHSRAWWRRHRAYLRRKRLREMRRRSTTAAARTPEVAPLPANDSKTTLARSINRSPVIAKIATRSTHAPFDLTLPASWSSAGANVTGEMKFNVRTLDGRVAGSAVLAPINRPTSDANVTARTKTLGGVPVNALRRTVIDRMVAEGGWVVNDMEREIRGRRVYIVLAQTGTSGGVQQRWTFYFTEVEGRLYRLATNTALELDEPLSTSSEQVVSTFRVGNGDAVAAKSPR
jgi:hypothetical protein